MIRLPTKVFYLFPLYLKLHLTQEPSAGEHNKLQHSARGDGVAAHYFERPLLLCRVSLLCVKLLEYSNWIRGSDMKLSQTIGMHSKYSNSPRLLFAAMVSLLACTAAAAQADVLQEAPVDLSNDLATELEAQLNDALENEENDSDSPIAFHETGDRWVYFVFAQRDCPDPRYNDGWQIHELSEWNIIFQKCSMHSAESYQKTKIRGTESSNPLIEDKQGCFNCHQPGVHDSQFNPLPIGGGMDVEDVLTKDISDLISHSDPLPNDAFNSTQYWMTPSTASTRIGATFLSADDYVFGENSRTFD